MPSEMIFTVLNLRETGSPHSVARVWCARCGQSADVNLHGERLNPEALAKTFAMEARILPTLHPIPNGVAIITRERSRVVTVPALAAPPPVVVAPAPAPVGTSFAVPAVARAITGAWAILSWGRAINALPFRRRINGG
jgi:hypothetical protein